MMVARPLVEDACAAAHFETCLVVAKTVETICQTRTSRAVCIFRGEFSDIEDCFVRVKRPFYSARDGVDGG